MKIVYTFWCAFFIIVNVNGQILDSKHSRVKIDLSQTLIEEIAKLGLETEHGVYQPGNYFINEFSDEEIDLLSMNNVDFEILIADVQDHYVKQNEQAQTREATLTCEEKRFDYQTPANYKFGSMGGFLTYEELLVTLDEMQEKYPHLISRKSPIDEIKTYEGRSIYFLKIGNTPDEVEDKPKVLYTALHHAREPASLSQMIFYMWYLLENYETNEEIQFLLEHTSLYFIPCLNPDGYVFNETMNPNGGGMWRKNRRPSDANAVGVDLNRNYGYKWANDDIGSSPNPSSQTYRGTEAFSEAETRAIRNFCARLNFELILNYHSHGNLMIYPWGFTDAETSHDHEFKTFSELLTNNNKFREGTALETVGYSTNGCSDDWMYGALGSFAFTPEVGKSSYGFWPPKEKIDVLNKSVLEQNFMAARVLVPLVNVKRVEDRNNEMIFEFGQYSLDSNAISIEIKSLHQGFDFTNRFRSVKMGQGEKRRYNFPYTIDYDQIKMEEVSFVAQVNYDEFSSLDTFIKHIGLGDSELVFYDDTENLNEWFSEKWGPSIQHWYGGQSSFTDSPNTSYESHVDSEITLIEGIDLSGAERAKLSYYARWDIEEDFDYAQVLISTDGSSYYPLCANYTEDGTVFQDYDQPVYDGVQDEWVLEEIDLEEYLGETIWIQFKMKSDAIAEQDGIYIDDIKVAVKKSELSRVGGYKFDNTFAISPNPFRNEFEILHDSEREFLVNIYDDLGRRVNKSEMAAGIFFFEIISDGERQAMLKGIKVK